MNHLMNLTKKELKELLAPSAIISIVVMMFLFMGMGQMISGTAEEATGPSKIGIVNGDPGGEWSEFVIDTVLEFYKSAYGLTTERTSEYVIILETPYGDLEEITKEMIDKGLTTAFGIVPGFSDDINAGVQSLIEEYYVFLNQGLLGSAVTSVTAPALITMISNSISYALIADTGEDASFLLFPIKQSSRDNWHTYINGEIYSGVTPGEISAAIMSQTMMVPIVIMIIIMVIGSMIIASMGSEKENKTIETLLTMPVKRTTIVSGKLIASAIVGLIYGIFYLIGMSFYMTGVMGNAGNINLADYGLSMGMTDWILMAVVIFLAIFFALGVCMIMGSFAKNYKAAQTMMLPIMVLTMVPMFITMFSSWGSLPPALQAIVFAIPFSHPMMGMTNLMMGDVTLVLLGIAYLFVFTLVVIWTVVRVYKSDILLTGLGATKFGKYAKLFITKRKT